MATKPVEVARDKKCGLTMSTTHLLQITGSRKPSIRKKNRLAATVSQVEISLWKLFNQIRSSMTISAIGQKQEAFLLLQITELVSSGKCRKAVSFTLMGFLPSVLRRGCPIICISYIFCLNLLEPAHQVQGTYSRAYTVCLDIVHTTFRISSSLHRSIFGLFFFRWQVCCCLLPFFIIYMYLCPFCSKWKLLKTNNKIMSS
jgi:hypothetical protein